MAESTEPVLSAEVLGMSVGELRGAIRAAGFSLDGVVEKYLTEDESNRLKNEAREPLKREVGDPVMDKHAKLPEGTTLREHLADKQAPRNYKVHDVQSMGDVGEL